MKIIKNMNETELTAALDSSLDTTTTPELEQTLKSRIRVKQHFTSKIFEKRK